jgi:hypothetical protein
MPVGWRETRKLVGPTRRMVFTAARCEGQDVDVDGSRFVTVRGGQNPSRVPSASASPQTLD